MKSRSQPDTFSFLNLCFQLLLFIAFGPFALSAARQNVNTLDFVLFSAYAFLLLVSINLPLFFLAKRLPTAALFALQTVFSIYFAWTFTFYLHYGLQLDSPLVLAGLRMGGMNGTKIPIDDLLKAFLIVALILCVEAALLYLSRNLLITNFISEATKAYRFKSRIVGYYLLTLIGFVFCATQSDSGTVPEEALPFFSAIASFNVSSIKFKYREETPKDPIIMQKKPDILFIMSDAFRWDQIDRELTPNLFRLMNSKNCSSSQRHYAGSHMTQYGGFSLLYGLNSFNFLPYAEARRSSYALKTLKENGYVLKAFDSSGLLAFSPPAVNRRDFDSYELFMDRNATTSEDSRVADVVGNEFKRKHHAPVFVFSFLFSTHSPYEFSGTGVQLRPNDLVNGSEEDRDAFRRYRSSVHYIDELAGRIIADAQSEINSNNLIIVFTGDHGEEFGETGSVGHAKVGFNDYKTRVPLIMCIPNQPSRQIALSSHADIFPTIFDWASEGTGDLSSFDGRSVLTRDDPYVIVSAAQFPVESPLISVFDEKNKFVYRLQTEPTEDLELYKVMSSSDQPVVRSESINAKSRSYNHMLKDKLLTHLQVVR